MKYCDRSPLTVYPNTRLSRAYSMFQKLGMRHLPVVSETGLVQGMITRKNLMAYLLTEEKEQELIKIRNVQIGAKRFLARRRRESDAWFEQHSTSNATTQEMTQSEFRKSIVAFRLGPKDLLPDPLPIERQEELMTFVNASSAGTIINKSMYRILLAKAREWRLNIMGDTNWLSLSYVDKLQTIAHVREWRHHDF